MRHRFRDTRGERRRGILLVVIGNFVLFPCLIGMVMLLAGYVPDYSRTAFFPAIGAMGGAALILIGWTSIREASAVEREARLRRRRAGRKRAVSGAARW